MNRRRMNQVRLFSSAGELANMVVTSNLLDAAWAKILEVQRGQSALPCSVQTVVDDQSPNRTIVIFAPSPDSTQYPLPQEGDLVPSPDFAFLRTKECPTVCINRAALNLFESLKNYLSGLKTQLIAREGQLIITGHSLGGSVASLFTLFLLGNMDKKSRCRPICITFGSPLIGNFGLQHSQWNSLFLHLVFNKDPFPGRLLPSSHSQLTTVCKPFGTYLFCSELGCDCLNDPDLILKILTVLSSKITGELQYVDYGEILTNLKNKAICKGPQLAGTRSADPFSDGIIMELNRIGIDPTKHNIDTKRMEAEARTLTRKTKVSDVKLMNNIKECMALVEWYKNKSKCYYDCLRNGKFKRDIKIREFMGQLTAYWEDIVADEKRKPQNEASSFRASWIFAGTNYRRMVEPLDIGDFYADGKSDYINSGRSPLNKLLQQWHEEVAIPQTRTEIDLKKKTVSVRLTEDSCFWAHVEEAILSCESLTNANSTTPEQRESSWNNLVKFEEYVMEQIDNYAVSPEIFLKESSFMKWWAAYKAYIDTFRNSHTSRLVEYMKSRSYKQYG